MVVNGVQNTKSRCYFNNKNNIIKGKQSNYKLMEAKLLKRENNMKIK